MIERDRDAAPCVRRRRQPAS